MKDLKMNGTILNYYLLTVVDYEDLIEKTRLQEHELADMYREQLPTSDIEPEVEAAILERKFLSYECLKHGWILTGYPRNVTEFRMLDMTETPPNRVCFFHIHPRQCYIRIFYREVDSCRGDMHRIPEIKPNTWGDHDKSDVEDPLHDHLKPHPKDQKQKVVREIEKYYLENKEMMKYCGRTASHVNAHMPIRAVFEYIEQVLINSAPACLPRRPLEIDDDALPTTTQPPHKMPEVKEKFRILTKKKITYLEIPKIRSEESLGETDSEIPARYTRKST